MSAHVVGIEPHVGAEFGDRSLKIAVLQQRSSELVMVTYVAQKIASRPGLPPMNCTFYMLILEIREWQNIWMARLAVWTRVKNVVGNHPLSIGLS